MEECGHGPVLLDRQGLFLESYQRAFGQARGPCYSTLRWWLSQEFQAFDKEWEFEDTMSSPYNSQSNGRAESPVKIAKRLFKRSADPYMALLEWRNTPTIDMVVRGCSPEGSGGSYCSK